MCHKSVERDIDLTRHLCDISHISLADSQLVGSADTGVTDSAPHRISFSFSWISLINTTQHTMYCIRSTALTLPPVDLLAVVLMALIDSASNGVHEHMFMRELYE